MEELHEECGVFGVFHHPQAAQLTYFGLHALQHRGQEGAGIAAADGRDIRCHKGKGLLTEAFRPGDLDALPGGSAVGHVRYGTAGGSELQNIQPLVARGRIGCLAAVHNGQIINAAELEEALESRGSIFQGTSDSEILLHMIQRGRGTLLEKITAACRRLDGAFAFLILTEKSLYAVRDKNGLRPLSLGKIGEGYCLSSETCAFESIGARFIRDIAPGEIVKLSDHGLESSYYAEDRRHRLCAMEYVYFSRPDSDLGGMNVHAVRKETGRMLARRDRGRLSADIVVGVPDSSLSAAMGYSEESGLPYEMGLIKNRYVGRTFIEPTQALRDMGVKLKLSANRTVVSGKRIVLLDDSLVRGTTSRRLITLLRGAGAKEVHLRIASPAIRYPCFYGVDMATREELASAGASPDELCRRLGADSLRFLEVDDLRAAYGGDAFCFACFDGGYVTPLYSHGAAGRG